MSNLTCNLLLILYFIEQKESFFKSMQNGHGYIRNLYIYLYIYNMNQLIRSKVYTDLPNR